MSKDTPEVGDVWEYKTDDKHKIHIVKEYKCYPLDGVFRSEKDCREYDCVHCCNTRKEIETSSYLKEDLIEYYTYLGKSKASIDDLFKTENEEYQALLSDSLAKQEGEDINAELEAENSQLKKWCEEFNALEVAKENIKLKELLKEAYPVIEFGDGAMMSKWEANWLTKAKEILGEDK